MTISKVGSARFKAYGALLLVNTIVLALSGHINHFQEFFYKADVFPLALSLATMIFILTMIFLDVRSQNAFTARPSFELGWLFVFGTMWLSFNAFSTSRWKYVSMGLCGTIPGDAQYAPYRTWCHELQALRAFVWIEWVIFLFTFAILLRWTITQHNGGRHDVWSTSFSRFSAYPSSGSRYRGDTNSEFLQWEKFPPGQIPQSPQQQRPATSPQEPPYTSPSQDPFNQVPQGYMPPSQAPQAPQAQYMLPSQAQFHHAPQAHYQESPQAY